MEKNSQLEFRLSCTVPEGPYGPRLLQDKLRKAKRALSQILKSREISLIDLEPRSGSDYRCTIRSLPATIFSELQQGESTLLLRLQSDLGRAFDSVPNHSHSLLSSLVALP